MKTKQYLTGAKKEILTVFPNCFQIKTWILIQKMKMYVSYIPILNFHLSGIY